MFNCQNCQHQFFLEKNLINHQKTSKNCLKFMDSLKCKFCDISSNNLRDRDEHLLTCEVKKLNDQICKLKLENSELRGRIQDFESLTKINFF